MDADTTGLLVQESLLDHDETMELGDTVRLLVRILKKYEFHKL